MSKFIDKNYAKETIQLMLEVHQNFTWTEQEALKVALDALKQINKINKIAHIRSVEDLNGLNCEEVILGLFKTVLEENPVEKQEPCTDAISRQAAIDAIEKLCEECNADYCGECRVKFDGVKNCKTILEQLPPVTPAEKVGRWVYNENLSTCYSDVYTCSECGERCLESCYERIEKLPDFCPKCHTKMEVEDEN